MVGRTLKVVFAGLVSSVQLRGDECPQAANRKVSALPDVQISPRSSTPVSFRELWRDTRMAHG